MSDFGQRTLAGQELMRRIAEDKRNKQTSLLESLEWPKLNFLHEIDIEADQTKPGEIQLVQISCKCGYRTEWKSFSLAITDYENHADNLWEVVK